MIRRVFRAVFGLVLRIFFRKVELAGLERVPAEGPIVFVLNHPNALIDPAFMLCLAPRPVSFLAKSTLFKIPVIKWITIGFDSLPVYRRQEGGDRSGNRETFRLARELLQRGGTMALFPEGTSHSDPQMRPMKTGAARIALGARTPGLQILPAGLYYDAKGTFRSRALVYFGEPFDVDLVELDEEGQPPRDAVVALTERIGEELGAVTLQAEQAEVLGLIDRAEQIFTAAGDAEDETMAVGFELQQRFVEGYHALKESHPERLAALESRLSRYEDDLDQLGLDPDHPAPDQFTLGGSLAYALRSLAVMLVPLPLALVGTVVHYPAYRLVGTMANRYSGGEDDMVGTVKILAALLFFPLTWALVCAGLWFWQGWVAGLVGLVVTPLTGYVAMRFFERFERIVFAVRGLRLFMVRRRFFERLHDERQQIRDEIVALAGLL